MIRNAGRAAVLACVAVAVGACGTIPGAWDGAKLRVTSDTTISGFAFPESVGCDTAAKVLYVSNFGGTELKTAEKDGKGYISKVALDGRVIEQRFLPAAGEIMNKPKGIWIQASRLWVTDIDGVWEFDTVTRKGRKIALPGAQFANDPAISGGALYVSDNRADQLFRVEPADFLDARTAPKVTLVWSGKSINPNGLYPSRDGSLLMAGFASPTVARAIYSMGADGAVKALTPEIGLLDGLYEMRDGTIVATDWKTGSLFRWDAAAGMVPLASGFKGPADFCVMPEGDGLTLYAPDLVKSEIRVVKLAP
jgi:sugar lactone lactonase YvrE